MSDEAYKPDQKFELLLINDSSNQVYEVLGISEDRSDEIVRIATDAYKSEKLFSDTLQKIVGQMNHINEVVFAVMCACKLHDRGRDADLEKKLQSLETLVKLLQLKMK